MQNKSTEQQIQQFTPRSQEYAQIILDRISTAFSSHQQLGPQTHNNNFKHIDQDQDKTDDIQVPFSDNSENKNSSINSKDKSIFKIFQEKPENSGEGHKLQKVYKKQKFKFLGISLNQEQESSHHSQIEMTSSKKSSHLSDINDEDKVLSDCKSKLSLLQKEIQSNSSIYEQNLQELSTGKAPRFGTQISSDLAEIVKQETTTPKVITKPNGIEMENFIQQVREKMGAYKAHKLETLLQKQKIEQCQTLNSNLMAKSVQNPLLNIFLGVLWRYILISVLTFIIAQIILISVQIAFDWKVVATLIAVGVGQLKLIMSNCKRIFPKNPEKSLYRSRKIKLIIATILIFFLAVLLLLFIVLNLTVFKIGNQSK